MNKTSVIVINLFVPGLGTLLGGKVVQGILQLALTIFAYILWFSFFGAVIGAFVGAVAFIWALVTGLNWPIPAAERTAPKSGIGR